MNMQNLLRNRFISGGLGGLFALFLAASLILGGCGGAGSNDNNGSGTEEDSGVINISLTDAAGDFVSYTVDVLSLTLTKANGDVVETLPVQSRIDFAQYTDMTEFLTAATVPSGVYVKGSITLDYSNADIWVEGTDGNAVKVNTILDTDGNPVSTMEASVRLEGRNRLVIAPGIPMHLSLDFDLEASNTIEFDDQGNPTQTVQPFLLAEVDVESNKIHRVRGPLQSVNLNESSFQIFIRPFHHPMGDGEGQHPFGSLKVLTDEETMYEIDGDSYQGDAGLQVLALQTRFTAVIVKGSLKFRPLRFEADEVYAGSSVPGGDMDVVRGSVVARSGDSLTLRGVTLMRRNGAVVFNDNVTVLLDASTTVKKQLSLDTFTKDDISVGQRLMVFGTITDDSISNLTVDAANGYARMLISNIRGTVVTNDDSPAFDLNLTRINGRRVSLYDFSGTGTDAANDADPTHYEVATSTLDVSGIAVDSPVAVRGFVRPFGTAPKDYDAITVIDRTGM